MMVSAVLPSKDQTDDSLIGQGSGLSVVRLAMSWKSEASYISLMGQTC